MKNKTIKKIAKSNYKRFCNLEGSQYIATEFALQTILRLINTFEIKNVLELGLGIGAVSDTVLEFAKQNNKGINYYGTENNAFCLSVLPNNVKDFNVIKLFSELKDIKKNTFDFIIIDGLDNELKTIDCYVNKHAILYVEGDRKGQTDILLNLFPKHKFVNVITLMKNTPYADLGSSVSYYIGGGKLIFVNPTFKMKLFYFSEKVKTFFIHRIRIYNRK